jgi:hypothetical protein
MALSLGFGPTLHSIVLLVDPWLRVVSSIFLLLDHVVIDANGLITWEIVGSYVIDVNGLV